MDYPVDSKNPVAHLPRPLAGYGLPTSKKLLLSWEHVSERMETSRTYWICTIAPGTPPHARPVWGVWVDNTLFFGGSPDTRWFRNLQENPQVSVHLEDGDNAVILEGWAELIENDPLLSRLDDAYEEKYNMRHGPPIWRMHLEQVFAWQSMGTMTKFLFE